MPLYYPQARAILSMVFDGFGEVDRDTPPKIIPVIPKELTVTRNAYNQADGWELVFDAHDMPIDPQMIRAGAVEIFLFATRGLGGNQRLIDKRFNALDEDDQQRTPIDTVMGEMGAASAIDRFTFGNRPMIAGLFDDQSMELSSNGQWATISGQDYTALLIAKQWPPTPKGRARRIPVGRRLDVILEEILDEADETGRLALVVENVDRADLPTVKPQLRSQKRGIPVSQDTNYWEVLYKLATRHGFIIFVRGLDVILTTPQNLDSDKDRRIRHMSWGRNLESLELTRHMGKQTTPAVVLKAYDNSLKEPITVDFPPGSFSKVKRSSRRSKSGKSSTNIRKTDEYQIIPVYGITDREVLLRMAESRYHHLGRSERVVRFSTRDMEDLDSRDIMDLASGDAIRIEFDEYNIDRALLANEDIDRGVKEKHLIDRGFGEAVAAVIASKYNQLAMLKRPLRVREVTYEFDQESGVSIEAELNDFIVPDGAREAAVKKPRKNKRRKKRDGTPVGLPPARERANEVQFADGDSIVVDN